MNSSGEQPALRLVVVSNRLPFTASSKDGKLVFRASPGGLVSGLTAYLESSRQGSPNRDYLWVGWPGIEIDESSQDKLRSEEHTSELQSRLHLVCRLLLEKKKKITR